MCYLEPKTNIQSYFLTSILQSKLFFRKDKDAEKRIMVLPKIHRRK